MVGEGGKKGLTSVFVVVVWKNWVMKTDLL